MGNIDDLARAGNSPIGFRSISQAYSYADDHPLLGEDDETADDKAVDEVVDEVLCSFFLPKLPGVMAVNNRDYRKKAVNLKEAFESRFESTSKILKRMEEGLPGQAAL